MGSGRGGGRSSSEREMFGAVWSDRCHLVVMVQDGVRGEGQVGEKCLMQLDQRCVIFY